MVLRLPEELHSSLRDREYLILRQLSNPDTVMYSGFFDLIFDNWIDQDRTLSLSKQVGFKEKIKRS